MEHALVMVLTPLSDVKAGDIVTIGALEGRVALRGENLVIETGAPSGPFVLDASDRIFVQRPLAVGMAATTSFNGDSYPCSVKAFSPSGHRVEVTRMRTRGPGLFTETRVIRECEAPVVFLENVSGHLNRGLREVVLELDANGLRAKAREIGVSVATVRARMRRGESRDEALRPAFYGEVLTARDGFEGTRAAHARRLGISRQAIDHRIKSGWDPHDAISLPREG